MDNIKLNVSEGTQKLVIRTGEAPKNIRLNENDFKGNIYAPADFFTGKLVNNYYASHNFADMLVQYSYDQRTIIFKDNITDNDGSNTVKGFLNRSKEVATLGINNGTKYSSRELAQLLKMNRIMFADRDQCMTLVANLQNFKAKVEADLENSNDNKGNKKFMFEQKVKQEYNLQFVLNSPIFNTDTMYKYTVEIMYDVLDAQVIFWLESVELKELSDSLTKEIIDAQLTRFGDLTKICTD